MTSASSNVPCDSPAPAHGQAVIPEPMALLREAARRAAFYRHVALRSVTVGLFNTVAIVLLSVLSWVLWTHAPEPRTLVLKPDGTLVEVKPLSEPVYSFQDIATYVDRALHYAHNYSFADYPWRNEETCRRFFTLEGCEAYRKAIERNIEAIRDKHLTSTISVEKPPLITHYGSDQGRYFWDVQVGIKLVYESANEHRSQTETVTVRVVRVNELQDTGGIGIHKYLQF